MKTPRILIHSIAVLCFPVFARSAGSLGSMATQSASLVSISGGTITGTTLSGITATSSGNIFTFSCGTSSLTINTANWSGGSGTVALGAITGMGTGVTSGLSTNTGSAGSIVLFNGAGGTPSSLTGTNITGTASGLTAGLVPLAGITGAGTGVTAGLATNTGSAGSVVINGGAMGTPSSGTATNLSGTASSLVAGVSLATGASTLTGTTLASGVTGSSLTSTGVVGTGTWSGSFGSVSGANLTGLSGNNMTTGTLGATYGGTGVNNGTKTLTLGGAMSTTGTGTMTLAFGSTGTITFPTTTATLARTDTTNNFAGSQSINSTLTLNTSSASLTSGGPTGAIIEARNTTNLANSPLHLYGTSTGTSSGVAATFSLSNTAGTVVNSGQIAVSKNNTVWSAGNEKATMTFYVAQNGTLNQSFNAQSNGTVVFNAAARLKAYTVSTLPASPTQGDCAFVTDALAPTFGAAVMNGGSAVIPVFYDGTNWICH